MIGKVTLENWKAYRALQIDFKPGTTFVVARNGIGKTSLMQAVAWALFGESALPFKPAHAIRLGEESATVSIDLEVSSARQVHITRTVDSRNRTSLVIDGGTGEAADSPDLGQILQDAFLADPSFLLKMCFVHEGSILTAPEAFYLPTHISTMLGLDKLELASGSARDTEREAERLATRVRGAQRVSRAEEDSLRARHRALEVSLDSLDADRIRLREELAQAQTMLASSESWESYREAIVRMTTHVDDLSHRVASSLGSAPSSLQDIEGRLVEVENALTEDMTQLQRTRAGLEARLSTIRHSLEELQGADARCPVCLRDIAPEEAANATEEHQAAIRGLEEQVRAFEPKEDKVKRRISDIRGLIQSARKVREPQPPSTPKTEVDNAQERVQAATEQLTQAAEKRAVVAQEAQQIRKRVDDEQEAKTLSLELQREYRRRALASLLHETSIRAAQELADSLVAPLAEELGDRWKLLWKDRNDLRLSGNQLVARRGAHEIPFSEFSGGEKVMSLLLIRLLTLDMASRASFLWLDEPLEHLDPRNRRLVASLLVKATEQARPRQIVATSYEEAVARRLAEQSEHATLLYVTSDPD